MQANQGPHRQCADCYYRVDGHCVLADKPETRRAENSDSCDMFTRASLRFAFFPKM
jgi:hypothetical protein